MTTRVEQAKIHKTGGYDLGNDKNSTNYKDAFANSLHSQSIFAIAQMRNSNQNSNSTDSGSSGRFSLSGALSQATGGKSQANTTQQGTGHCNDSIKSAATDNNFFKKNQKEVKTLTNQSTKLTQKNVKTQKQLKVKSEKLNAQITNDSNELENLNNSTDAGALGKSEELTSKIAGNKSQLGTIGKQIKTIGKSTLAHQKMNLTKIKGLGKIFQQKNADNSKKDAAAKSVLKVSKVTSTVGSAIGATGLVIDGIIAATAWAGGATTTLEGINAYIKPTGHIVSAAGSSGEATADLATGNIKDALIAGGMAAVNTAGAADGFRGLNAAASSGQAFQNLTTVAKISKVSTGVSQIMQGATGLMAAKAGLTGSGDNNSPTPTKSTSNLNLTHKKASAWHT